MKRTAPIALLLALTSCASTSSHVRDFKIGLELTPRPEAEVPVYDSEALIADRPRVYVAAIQIAGNGFSTRQSVRKQIARKAAKFGADFVLIDQEGVDTSTRVHSFGYYSGWSSPIAKPAALARYGVWLHHRVGIAFDDNLVATDVRPGGPLDLAGARIGDRLLAIDDTRFGGSLDRFGRCYAHLEVGKTYAAELARGTEHVTIYFTPTPTPDAPP